MIKFIDLYKINQPYENAFQNKLRSVLDSGWYILGEEVKLFERNFAHYCQSKYCIGVGNGFDALTLIYKGYIQLGKMQKGDEVIVPANTYIASILSIIQADLVPVLVEPKLETYTIDPNLITEKITYKTRSILAVNLYGQLAELDAINEIAIKNNLIVVEDSAQSHGATLENNKSINTQAFSFYPGKNLGALGIFALFFIAGLIPALLYSKYDIQIYINQFFHPVANNIFLFFTKNHFFSCGILFLSCSTRSSLSIFSIAFVVFDYVF